MAGGGRGLGHLRRLGQAQVQAQGTDAWRRLRRQPPTPQYTRAEPSRQCQAWSAAPMSMTTVRPQLMLSALDLSLSQLTHSLEHSHSESPTERDKNRQKGTSPGAGHGDIMDSCELNLLHRGAISGVADELSTALPWGTTSVHTLSLADPWHCQAGGRTWGWG